MKDDKIYITVLLGGELQCAQVLFIKIQKQDQNKQKKTNNQERPLTPPKLNSHEVAALLQFFSKDV